MKNQGKLHKTKKSRRVDVQVTILTGLMVAIACLCLFAYGYHITYKDMVKSLDNRVESIYTFIEKEMDKTTFENINTKEDMKKKSYKRTCELFANIRHVSGVKYFYTAKRNEQGELIYIIDGLDRKAEDIRYPGDLIEPEIKAQLNKALDNKKVIPKDIVHTDWGDIFITYLPVHDSVDKGKVIGAVGIEFAADHQYSTYKKLSITTYIIILIAGLLSSLFAFYFFRRISNPNYQDLATTDYLTKLKNRNAYELSTKNMCAMGVAEGTCLVLVDLNGLKLTNDTNGHEAGDEYIRCMADSLREASSEREVLYRLGGDEFVAMILNANNHEIERFLSEVNRIFQNKKPQLMEHASFSVGSAMVESNQEDAFEVAYGAADERMYKNKKKHYEEFKI